MESSCLCKICTFNYDEDNNIPYLLPCSHSLCKECLKKIWDSPNRKCPFCNKYLGITQFNEFKPNYTIIEILKDLMKCYEKCDNCELKLRNPNIIVQNRKVDLLCENCVNDEKYKKKSFPLASYINQLEIKIANDKKEYEEKYYSKFKEDFFQNFYNVMKKNLTETIEKLLNNIIENMDKQLDAKLSKYFYEKLNLISDSIKEKEEIILSLKKLNSFLSDKKSLENHIMNFNQKNCFENFIIDFKIFEKSQNLINEYMSKSLDSLKSCFNSNFSESLGNSMIYFKKAFFQII